MTDETSAAQRDVEQARSDLGQTIEALKHKMTTSELLSELRSQVFPDGGAQVMSRSISTLTRQVQENPLALSLIGAGLAWMMFGRDALQDSRSRSRDELYGSSSSQGGDYRSYHGDAGRREDERFASGYGHDDRSSRLESMARSANERLHDAVDTVSGVAQSAVDSVGSTISSAQDAIGSTLNSAQDALGSTMSSAQDAFGSAASRVRQAADGISDTAADAMHASSRATRDMQRTAADLLERYPLAVGAVALAIGAAIGGALPTSRVEERAVRNVVGDPDAQAASGENRDMSDAYSSALRGGVDAAADVSGMTEDDADEASIDTPSTSERRWPGSTVS